MDPSSSSSKARSLAMQKAKTKWRRDNYKNCYWQDHPDEFNPDDDILTLLKHGKGLEPAHMKKYTTEELTKMTVDSFHMCPILRNQITSFSHVSLTPSSTII